MKLDVAANGVTAAPAKRKATDKANERIGKREKAGKEPGKPKRPPSAFFIFMEEFRVQFKAKNPGNKSVAVVGKAGGDKWRSMSDAEKAPHVAKAEKRKAEYEKLLAAYGNKKAGAIGAAEDGNGSDKSKSEVNNGEGEAESSED